MEEIWEIAGIWLLSTVKFVLGGVPLALALGFSFFKTVVVTCTGGFVGVLIFVNLSGWIVNKLKAAREKRDAQRTVKRKVFTRTNKVIVTVKRRFGLPGIALITPLLLSIPIGCFVAVRYFDNRQKIVMWMFLSLVFWAVSLSSYKLFFP